MNKKNNVLNDAFDLLLDEAAENAAEHLGQNLQEPEEQIEFSAEHEQKMQWIFRQEHRKLRRRKIMKYTKIAACMVGVLILSAGITISSVDAWRVKVLNYVLDFNQPNTDFSFNEPGSGQQYEGDDITLGYIPDGFELTEQSKSRMGIILAYTKEEQYFDISFTNIGTSFSVDTEDGTVEKITFKGYEAVYTSNPNINALVWHDNELVFKVLGNISKEEIFKIAEGIEK